MLKFRWIFLIPVLFSIKSFGQDVSLALQKPLRLSEAQWEARWKKAPETVVSFASSGVRYQQDIPASLVQQKTWNARSWKNEKVHTQLVVSAKKILMNCRFLLVIFWMQQETEFLRITLRLVLCNT